MTMWRISSAIPTPQPVFTTRTANATKYRNLDSGRARDWVVRHRHDDARQWDALAGLGRERQRRTGGRHRQPELRGAEQPADALRRRIGTSRTRQTRERSDATAEARRTSRPMRTRGNRRSTRSAAAPAMARGFGRRRSPDLPSRRRRCGAARASMWRRRGCRCRPMRTGCGTWGSRSSAGWSSRSGTEIGRGDPATPWTGFLVANGTLRDLPPGSHLDPATGVFTWTPGPGYIGTYRLTFVRGPSRPRRRDDSPRGDGRSHARRSADVHRLCRGGSDADAASSRSPAGRWIRRRQLAAVSMPCMSGRNRWCDPR